MDYFKSIEKKKNTQVPIPIVTNNVKYWKYDKTKERKY